MVADIEKSTSSLDRVLLLTRDFQAPRPLVFEAWTDPRHLVRWWGPKDFTLPHYQQDFRVGGSYRLCMRSPEGEDHWVWGVYREIVEQERIVFTWNRDPHPEMPRAESVVSVTLAEHDGGTRLTLHHAIFQSVRDRNEHVGGWTECLQRLGSYVETFMNRSEA